MKLHSLLIFSIVVVLFTPKLTNAQWVPTQGPGGGTIVCLAVSGSNVFAGTYSAGVFLSTNNGANWRAINNGMTNSVVYAITTIGTNVFAGTYGSGVFLSTDNGANWKAVNNGLTRLNVISFAVIGSNFFAGTDGGVFLSTGGEREQSLCRYDRREGHLCYLKQWSELGNSQ